MKFEVPIRKVEYYEAEDNRKIEVHSLYAKVETEFDTNEKLEFVQDKTIYVGVSPTNGFTIKFRIPNATSVEAAFQEYIPLWEKIEAEYRRQAMVQSQSQIVTANQQDLANIDQIAEKTGKIII